MIQGEQAQNDLCLRKGYKIGTFYKFLLNEGKITPKWNENLINYAIELIKINSYINI